MYHKAIETKKDAIDYLRKGDPSETLKRLEELSIILNITNTEVPDEEIE